MYQIIIKIRVNISIEFRNNWLLNGCQINPIVGIFLLTMLWTVCG